MMRVYVLNGLCALAPRLSFARLAAVLVATIVCTAAAPALAMHQLTLAWETTDGTPLEQRELSIDEVEGLETAHILTDTPWTDRPTRYDGVLFSALAQSGPGSAVEARLVALNDYSITVPARDWETWPLILATRIEGVRMRVRDKGPFWLIYPLDAHPQLRRQVYFARMIWQIRRITFVVEPE